MKLSEHEFSESAEKPNQWMSRTLRPAMLARFLRFSVVGGSGVVLDIGILYLLHQRFGWRLDASKVAAATTALISNFFWNDFWTFRDSRVPIESKRISRFWRFGLICGSGMLISVGVLHVLVTRIGWMVFPSNLVAIVIASVWNFTINDRWNWRLDA